MKIIYSQKDETLLYAVEELIKYLRIMDPKIEADSDFCCNASMMDGEYIKLGLLEELGLDAGDVEDSAIDDVVDINIQNLSGYIAGSNIRSILQGVYIYLKSAGCMWVRPGIEGEYIPKRDMKTHSFVYRKKADLPIRGEVSEGALSKENLFDTIIWSPKVGMNSFYMQFVYPVRFMRRWYEHELSTAKTGKVKDFEVLKGYCIEAEKLIKKCGLQLHSVGHGYQTATYGLDYYGPGCEYKMTDELRDKVALLKGKRELYQNSPVYTQMCYSNPSIRADMVKFLADYLKKHPSDYLHVALADSFNNQCECDRCKETTPSDSYVMLLNELDEEFTARNIDTKICCILYVDTFWAPKKARLNNPDRFLLNIALQRDYNVPLSDKRSNEPLPKWERNKYFLNPTSELVLKFWDSWKPIFNGPVMTFDYDLYMDHYVDPGYMSISEFIHKDIKKYPSLGFAGRLSCQTQRCAFPTALPNAVMAETLYDTGLNYRDYTKKYFAAAYGEQWEKAFEYLNKITELFNPSQLRNKENVVEQDTQGRSNKENKAVYIGNDGASQRLASIPNYIDKFLPSIEANCKLKNSCQALSWKILKYHADYCKRLSAVYYLISVKDKEGVKKAYSDIVDWVSGIEDEIQPYFDAYLFIRKITMTVDGIIKK